MKKKKFYYLILTILAMNLLACGEKKGTEDSEPAGENSLESEEIFSENGGENPASADAENKSIDEGITITLADDKIAYYGSHLGAYVPRNISPETEKLIEAAREETLLEEILEAERIAQEKEEKEARENVSDYTLVDVRDYIPNIGVDMIYATADNFCGQVLYEDATPYLRYGTVKKLAIAEEMVEEDGYRLLIWDAYRPLSVQFLMWEIVPIEKYVANPNKGGINHNCGNTVDITLIYEDGSYVEMPTGFDDFSDLADRDYSDVSVEAGNNAKYLEDVMVTCGFKGLRSEWWHYEDTVGYDVVDE